MTVPLPAAPVDQHRRGQCQQHGEPDRDGTGGATVTVSDGGEGARQHDREQQRQLELHDGGLGGRHLRLHRHRHDLGGDQRRIEPVSM